MSYAETQRYLYSLKYHGASYGIDRIQVFAQALGHPCRTYPVIHVAGTNGKGSTCAMLEAIYRAAGLKTGLYTSPHLVYLGERIQVNRQPLAPDAITAYVERLRPIAEAVEPAERPSFFEFMTGMAFQNFADEQVDVGIIETGLGGRLDATNIVLPDLSIITSIGIDHTQQLGDTVEKIAAEKAGIIKPGAPVLIGRMPPEAEAVIRGVAAERGCRVYSVTERYGDDLSNYPASSLEGDFQRINAALATMAVEIMQSRLSVPQEAIDRGLATVEWAGRWQRVRLKDGRLLILDATHNAEGARMLEKNIEQLKAETGRDPVILAGSLGKTRAEALLDIVCRHAKELILFEPKQPRATSYEELRSCIPPGFDRPVFLGDVAEVFPAPGYCTEGEPGDVLVATGSIYLIGEICERLFPAALPGEAMLQDVI